jgi:hypothetical protein
MLTCEQIILAAETGTAKYASYAKNTFDANDANQHEFDQVKQAGPNPLNLLPMANHCGWDTRVIKASISLCVSSRQRVGGGGDSPHHLH